MKNLFLTLLLALAGVIGFAQNGVDPEFASYMIETERRTVFVQNMDLNAEQAPLFWELYDAYEAELKVIREAGIENLKNYNKNFDGITAEQCDEYMKISLKHEAQRTAIRKKYYKKMAKALDAKIASRFLQLDEIVTMVLFISIYDELPLIGDK
jgi:hypothetical protein